MEGTTMARKRCVLFQHITKDRDSAGLLIEQLRYAGLVKVIKETEIESGTAYMLEINCPKGLNDLVWAQQNAERMRSFGINAQDAFSSNAG
jgi:hypothetical protein